MTTQQRRRRFGWVAAVMAVAVAAGLLVMPAQAEPIDPWDYEAYDCLNDRWNLLDEDGNRTGATPEPGTPEWTAYNDSHVACTDQRDSDRNQHPVPDSGRSAATYGTDPYRDPAKHDGTRFHHNQFGTVEIPTVSSAEGYRPCSTAPGDCPDLPDGLERFDGPHPVVIVMHGVIAQDIHHRFNTQTFAENGYMAFGVDGYGVGYAPGVGGPNVQRCDNANDVLNWLASDASGEWGQMADLSRVAIVGHSQGSGCARGYQGDPRVDAIIAWDGGDTLADNNCVAGSPCAPIMFQRTDGGFSSPQSYPDGYPSGRDRGLTAYQTSIERGMDVMHLNMRDTVHTDWNGYGTGLAGNRLFELASNYYNVAWLDRHLKGKLEVDADGDVVTSDGRSEAEERAYRQAEAQDAFDRLVSKKFLDGTIDKHNISMGFWDPDKAEASGDPLFGGNVPYEVEGTWAIERLSPFYRNFCSVSVPDYVTGADGGPGSKVVAKADSGADGDMRLTGCVPQTTKKSKGGAKPCSDTGRGGRPCEKPGGPGEEEPEPEPEYPVQPSDRVNQPTVIGPIGDEGIRTKEPFFTTLLPLPDGWVEEEFFYEGVARTSAQMAAGEEGTTAYRSRIMVRRPSDPAEFNGTVVVDWNNVTVPQDRDVAWHPLYHTLLERGYAYVSVAAQRLSIEASPLALKQYDPVRYGSLSHPGDDYSFDIFSQAAEAVLSKEPSVLGELRPYVTHRLAMGASQSGGRLKTYINTVHEHSLVFDGFQPQISGASGVRTDLVPIVWVNSGGEADDEDNSPADGGLFRLWEIAGTAHTSHGSSQLMNDNLVWNHSNGMSGPKEEAHDIEDSFAWGYQLQPGACARENFSVAGLTWSAALVTLDNWVKTGEAPPSMPRLTRDENGRVYDEHGNMVGGVRAPYLDVPIATYYGGDVPDGSTDPCAMVGGRMALSGYTRMFSAAKLDSLYASADDYIAKFNAAVDAALASGFILPEGAAELRERVVRAAAILDRSDAVPPVPGGS